MIRIPDKYKIENLLSHYGLTLMDMPHKYKPKDRKIALDVIHIWGGINIYERNNADYYCHLFDIIDRLTRALEIAVEKDGGMVYEGRCIPGDADTQEPAPEI